MDRNPEDFPDNVNGDTLWKMLENGDDLSSPEKIEFTVTFPAEEEAPGFGKTLLINRQENQEFPFEIVVYVYEEISGYEELLELHASPDNRQIDG